MRARLSISTDSHGDEQIELPVAAGRQLDSLFREGFAPQTRGELLDRTGAVLQRCAHARMEQLVARRDLSSHELSQRLAADGYPERIVGPLVVRAREVGIVDDLRYGASFIRSKVSSGWGPAKIERELSRRGIDASSVPGWPEEFLSADEEHEHALALASRRRLTGKHDVQKIARFLCSRGFSSSLAFSVAREVLDGAGE